MFFMRQQDDGTSIRVYDFEAKRERSPDFRSKHGRGHWKHNLAISPDGQQLAFIGCLKDGHSLQIAPAAGGETREVIMLTQAGLTAKTGLAWTPDGRHLLFGKWKDEATELWRIPVEGGEPENLGLAMGRIEHLSIHPDGRRIAFTGPGLGRDAEIWAMENILPKSTASR
jgi:Tol biopolymer transport system component